MQKWRPYLIIARSFQRAWIEAASFLFENKHEARNLTVYIEDVTLFDNQIHKSYDDFCRSHKLLRPKQVAYTIFPQCREKRLDARSLFHRYNKKDGIFDRIKTRWGTYFRRMSHYDTGGDEVNQLGKIIEAIRQRRNVYKAAYTMIVQKPGSETTRTVGGPCLNYIALQIKPEMPKKRIGLLAVYRNQDFLVRAYGNYLGLTHLLQFICDETDACPGPLTCFSSHAYLACGNIRAFRQFLQGLK